ncbi:MAG: cytochrome c [Cyanobacteria bacterium Co-bin13]|nr:cytochrome c [Cyanobacteria bacterium Co-bin13]
MTQETFEEQPSELTVLLQKEARVLFVLFVAVLTAILFARYLEAADPYIHQVLVLQGDHNRGEAIFRMNCAVCHGIEATGEVGPDLRGVSDHKNKVSLIKQVTSGKTPPMPQFQPNPQDMADLLEYLEGL